MQARAPPLTPVPTTVGRGHVFLYKYGACQDSRYLLLFRHNSESNLISEQRYLDGIRGKI